MTADLSATFQITPLGWWVLGSIICGVVFAAIFLRARIFISYRRKDLHEVKKLKEKLRVKLWRPVHIFIDTDNIPAGKEFENILRLEIQKADLVIAFISKHWEIKTGEKIDWVHLELRLALDEEKTIIPLLWNETPIPEREHLPADLKKLSSISGIKLRKGQDYNRDLAAIIPQIRQYLPWYTGSPFAALIAVSLIGISFYFGHDHLVLVKNELAPQPIASEAQPVPASVTPPSKPEPAPMPADSLPTTVLPLPTTTAPVPTTTVPVSTTTDPVPTPAVPAPPPPPVNKSLADQVLIDSISIKWASDVKQEPTTLSPVQGPVFSLEREAPYLWLRVQGNFQTHSEPRSVWLGYYQKDDTNTLYVNPDALSLTSSSSLDARCLHLDEPAKSKLSWYHIVLLYDPGRETAPLDEPAANFTGKLKLLGKVMF